MTKSRLAYLRRRDRETEKYRLEHPKVNCSCCENFSKEILKDNKLKTTIGHCLVSKRGLWKLQDIVTVWRNGCSNFLDERIRIENKSW